MNCLRNAAVAAIVLFSFATAGLAANKTKCTDAGRVFGITGGDFPAVIRLAVAKANTDADLGVFETATGDVVGLGLTATSRWEEVTFGPAPGGVEYDIVVVKASGPNSTCYLYFFDDFPFNSPIVSSAREAPASRLRDKGRLVDLARADARYARVLKTMERYKRVKGPLRGDK